MVKEKYLPYIPPEKKEEPPKTQKELRKEKWENFWFYHKWAVLIPVISLVVLVGAFLLVKPDSNPDLTVILVTSDRWEEKERMTELQEMLCPYATDLSGDTIVNIKATQFVIDQTNPDEKEVQRLLETIQSGSTYFFVCDEENARWLAEEGILSQLEDRNALAKDAEFEKYAVDWNTNKLFANDYFFSLKDTHYFCLRYYTDTTVADAANTYYWSTSLLRMLMENTPMDSKYFDSLWTYQEKCWEAYGKDTSRPVTSK